MKKDCISISIKKFLKEHLTPEKYRHSLNVSVTAVKLAKKHGLDQKKARLAGLLHDSGKNLEAMRKLGILGRLRLGRELKSIPWLWHAKAGVELSKSRFQVADREILEAVEHHAASGPGMGKLAKVIYLADKIEPLREYQGVKAVRKLAFLDLDAAMLASLGRSIAYIASKGRQPYSVSVKVFEELIIKCSKR